MQPTQSSQPYANQLSQASREPKPSASQVLLVQHGEVNHALRSAVQRLEDALSRLGHVFPPQPKSESGIAGVPNGFLGSLSEKIQETSSLSARMHELLETLSTYV